MKRLVVVTNDQLICELITTMLEHLGYLVDVATDLPTAFRMMQRTPPDGLLVFTHPTRLPAEMVRDAYACHPFVRHVPAAIFHSSCPDKPLNAPVQIAVQMPFSLDDFVRAVWALVEPEPSQEHAAPRCFEH